MASTLNVGGYVTREPGAYSEADASALGGTVAETKAVAVVGAFPWLEKATLQSATGAQALSALHSTNRDLARVASLLYSPASDDRVTGGPSSVVLVSNTVSTQAQRAMLDSGGNTALTVKAKLWGPDGNQITIAVVNNATDATLRDWEISGFGITEEFDEVGTGKVVDIYHDSAEGEASIIKIAGTDPELRMTKTLAVGTFNPSELIFGGGVITATPAGAQSAGQTGTLTIAGINASTGLADTEDVTWSDAEGTTPKSSTKLWSDVTALTWASTDGGFSDALALAWVGKSFPDDDFASVQHIVDWINQYNAREYYATALDPRVGQILPSELDTLAVAVDINGAVNANGWRADLWDTLQTLAASTLIDVERGETSPDGTAPPVAVAGAVFLAGGTKATPGNTDWQDALTALEDAQVNLVTVLSSDAAIHKLLREHCKYMAGAGSYPRSGWVGGASLDTESTILSNIRALNTRHLSYVFQDAEVDLPDGRDWIAPYWYALMHMGIQCGLEVGGDVTWKRPNVVGVRQHASINLGIKGVREKFYKGHAVFTWLRRSFLIIGRDTTTYLTDDNPIWGASSAVESLNVSLLDLTEWLSPQIGESPTSFTQGELRQRAIDRLFQQADPNDLNIIKGFDPKTVDVRDGGDRYLVDYVPIVKEGTKFVKVTARPRRTAG